jgi:hypothetical protein
MKKNKGRCRREKKESGWGNLGVWESWGDEKKARNGGRWTTVEKFQKVAPAAAAAASARLHQKGLKSVFSALATCDSCYWTTSEAFNEG